MKNILKVIPKIITLILFLFIFHNVVNGQCNITIQQFDKTSENSIKITGHTIGCNTISVHWFNPGLPDKSVNISDIFHDELWTIEYTTADGLTPQMMTANFFCGSNNFSFATQCQNQGCFVSTGNSSIILCKDAPCPENVLLIVRNGNNVLIPPSQCLDAGNYTVSPSTELPPGMDILWSVNGTINANTSAAFPIQITDGDNFDITFSASGFQCNILTSRNLESCENADSTNPPPDDTTVTPPDDEAVTPPPCTTCEFCGGDWGCCLAWVLIFISLFVLVATILYLFCDPSGGGGWGWLILAVSAIVLGLALWWLIANCDFNLCTLLQVIVTALTFDFVIVCAIEGLFPCLTSVICGVTIIGGISIRNWFIILVIGALLLLGISVVCPNLT